MHWKLWDTHNLSQLHKHKGHYRSISPQWLECPVSPATSLMETWQKHTCCVGRRTKCGIFHPVGNSPATCLCQWIHSLSCWSSNISHMPLIPAGCLRWARRQHRPPVLYLLLGWPCWKELQNLTLFSLVYTSITLFLTVIITWNTCSKYMWLDGLSGV